MSDTPTIYSEREEKFNVLTHVLGILLGLAGLAAMVWLAATRGDAWKMASAWIFGLSMVLLYTTSSLYHAARDPARRRAMRKCDHAGIFLLIAGSYTPFLLVCLRGPWGWSLFGVIWTIALAGVLLKFRYTGRFRLLSTLIYIGMGWLVVVAAKPMLAAVPAKALWLLLAGGLAYTGGTVFYMWKKLPYHHGLWHLCVLGGSACHFAAVVIAVFL